MLGLISSLVLASSSSNLVQVLFIIAVFIILLFAAYYTTRFTGRVRAGALSDKNMQIIEAIMVGPQKSLQLVRVGSEYFVIAVTKDRISLISAVDKDTIDLSNEVKQSESFKDIINNMINKNK